MIRRNANGYTIIETMMFLIISASLFGTVIIAMTQQNRRNQFTQSVDAMQVKLQDVLNDVSTGFYPYTTGFTCSGGQNNTPPSFSTSSTNEQGANLDCVFVGKALQLEPQGEPGTYNIYTMVGNRQLNSKDVESLADATPVLMGTGGRPGIVDTGQLAASVEVKKVISNSNASVGGFVIVSDFSKKSAVGSTVSGNASRVSVWPVAGTSLNMQTGQFATTTADTNNINTSSGAGVIVCMQESGGGRKASLTIGGSNQQLSVERTIDSWPAGCDS